MFQVNSNFKRLQGSYLFSEIGRRVSEYTTEHPEKDVIRLGIGDVTKPLVPAVIEAISHATEDMSREETFRGYGPEQGYDILREANANND